MVKASTVPTPHYKNETSPLAKGFYYPHTNPSPGTALPAKDFHQNEKLPLLFQPINVGGLEFKNRIWVAPMCQYSSDEGKATPWHMVHLGALAVRGSAFVLTEATSVTPNGRISPEDAGIWNDEQRDALKPIVAFIKANGAHAGIQLAHAGRKASTLAPWYTMNLLGGNTASHVASIEANGWDDVWAPSALSYNEHFPDVEAPMSEKEIEEFKAAWKAAVVRADEAGFDVIEVHAAHGYLMHEFLSPISNKRTDKYGGSLENRMRLALEIIDITRETFPKEKPVFLRISATDSHPEGEKDEKDGSWISWGVEQSKVLVAEAARRGVTLVDVSSSGNDSRQKLHVGPGYQVPFADAIRNSMTDENRIHVSSVGLITSGKQAEDILQRGQSDIVTIAREFLRDAELVFNWAHELGVVVNVPVQYQRAYTRIIKKDSK